jgi:translation initiation factor IF-2
MSDEKKYKVADLAEELSISAQELLDFLKENDVKVASPSSKVTEGVRNIVISHFSDEKKLSDAHRKHKEEKERRRKTIEAKAEAMLHPRDTKVKKPAPAVSTSPTVKPLVEKSVEVVRTAEPEVVAASVGSSEPIAPVLEPHLVEASVVEAVAETDAAKEASVVPVEMVAEVADSMNTNDASANHDESIMSEPIELTVEEPELVVAETDSMADAIEENVDDDTEDNAVESETQTPDARTELQREIGRQQVEISNRFASAENVGGLKVLGAIDLFKKKRKRKKSFGEQAKDLTAQKNAPATPPKPQPKPAEAKAAEQKVAEEVKPPSEKPAEATAAKSRELFIDKEVSKGKKKGKKFEVDEKTLDRNIRQTIMNMDDGGEVTSRQKFRKMRRREREEREEIAALQREAEDKIIKTTEFASAHEFADLLGITPKEVIEKCFRMGKFITINQRLDRETLELLALEFGREIQFVSDIEATQVTVDEDNPEDMSTRPPVVTIMGHVDHGKTSLLDYIRRSNVVAGEAGGITQHIGAYEVTLESGQQLTFLDTPGHEAFTAMRARGAQATDIVILVVAADDSVMPQTLEAINHAKAANVPIVVAINKVDKPEANPDKIRTQLSENGVLVEEWGGDVQCQEISAKKGTGVRELIDKVLVQAELMNLKANFNKNRLAKGVVVEAELDKGKGVVATVLVQNGVLKVGDPFVAGSASGRVRAMLDERGRRVAEATPSQPVRILGFESLPEAGDIFNVVPSDREAREISQRRQLIRREQLMRTSTRIKLNDIAQQVKDGSVRELRLIVKADVSGSIEALSDGLMKAQTNEVKVQIIHRGVGQITETDVLLAAASDAIIIGFRVRPNLNAKRLAEKEEIDIRFYTVIYHALEEIKDALEGMLAPEVTEETVGVVEIREVFRISKIGIVAGCYVLEGTIKRDAKVRLLRDGIQIFEGALDSLKRFKDDVREVEAGYECGLSLAGFHDIKVGDIIEAFQTVETKRKLVMQ